MVTSHADLTTAAKYAQVGSVAAVQVFAGTQQTIVILDANLPMVPVTLMLLLLKEELAVRTLEEPLAQIINAAAWLATLAPPKIIVPTQEAACWVMGAATLMPLPLDNLVH